MIKYLYSTMFVLALFSVPIALYGQGGCTDSPEAPTVVLLLVGMAGVFGPSLLRKRPRLQAVRRGGIR